jgi:hypothetical protein
VILSCVYLKLTDQTRCRRYQQVDEVVIGLGLRRNFAGISVRQEKLCTHLRESYVMYMQ